MIDGQESPDSAKAVTFEIEFECHLFGLLIIAERMRLRRVLTATILTLIALAAGAIESAFDLTFGRLAMWASVHVKRYNIVMADLDSPDKQKKLTLDLIKGYA